MISSIENGTLMVILSKNKICMYRIFFLSILLILPASNTFAQVAGVIQDTGPLFGQTVTILLQEIVPATETSFGVGSGVMVNIENSLFGLTSSSNLEIQNRPLVDIPLDQNGRPTPGGISIIQSLAEQEFGIGLGSLNTLSGFFIDMKNEVVDVQIGLVLEFQLNQDEFFVSAGASPGASLFLETLEQSPFFANEINSLNPIEIPFLSDFDDVGMASFIFTLDAKIRSDNLIAGNGQASPINFFSINGNDPRLTIGWNTNGHYFDVEFPGLKSLGKAPSFLSNGTGKAGEPVTISIDGLDESSFTFSEFAVVDVLGQQGESSQYSLNNVPFTFIPSFDVSNIQLSENTTDFSFNTDFSFPASTIPYSDLGGIDFTSMDISGIRIDEESATLNFIYGLGQDESGVSVNLDEEAARLRKIFLQSLAIPNDKQYISLDILSNPTRGFARVDDVFKQTDLARYFYEADVQMKKDVLKKVIADDGNGNALYQKWVELIRSDATLWQQLTNLGFNSYPYLTIRGTILPNVFSSSDENKHQLFLNNTDVGFSLDRTIVNLGINLSPYPLTENQTNYINTQMGVFRNFLTSRLNEEADGAISRMNAGADAYRNLQSVLSAVAAAHWYKTLNLPNDPYADLIDSEDLTGIESEIPFNQEYWDGQAYQLLGSAQYNDLYDNPITIDIQGGVTMRDVINAEQTSPITENQQNILVELKSEDVIISEGKYFIDGGRGSVELPELSITQIHVPFEDSINFMREDFVFSGSSLDVSIEILNSGNESAQNILVELFTLVEEVKVKVGSTLIPAIGISEVRQVQIPFLVQPNVSGEINLFAELSLNNNLQRELDLTNNSRELRIFAVDPRPRLISLEPLSGSSLSHENAFFNIQATDVKGESLSYSWISDVDSLLGEASQFTVPSLTPGYHTITLVVENESGFKTEFPFIIFVFEGTQDEPVLTVNYPLEGEEVRTDVLISASAVAADFLEGDLCKLDASAITWTSSLDGQLGIGCNPQLRFTTPGLHMMTITATNSNNKSASQLFELHVHDGAPQVTITEITPQLNILETDQLTLTGAATDATDGNLADQIIWSSSIQGYLGKGDMITTNLDPGAHIIRAMVSNSLGANAIATSDTIFINPIISNNQLFSYTSPGTYTTQIEVRNGPSITHASLDIQGIGIDVGVPDGATFSFPPERAPSTLAPVSIPSFPTANVFYGISGNNSGGIAIICPDFTIPESPLLNYVESVFLPGGAGTATFIQLYVESGARIGFTLPYELNIYLKKGGNITYLHPESTGTIYYEDGAFINEHDEFPSGVTLIRIPNLSFQYPNGTAICTTPLVTCPPQLGTSLSSSFNSAFELGESRMIEVDYHPNAARYHWTLPVGWTAIPLNRNGNKIQLTAPSVPSSGFLRVYSSNDCATSGTISLGISSGLSTTRPSNPRLDVLQDGVIDWSQTGPFTTKQTTHDLAQTINQFLATYEGTDEYVSVPLGISYQGGGQLIGTNLSIKYGGKDVAINQINPGLQPIQFQSDIATTPISVSLTNVGDEDLFDIDAALLINGMEVVRSDRLISLSVGERDTISFQWPYESVGEKSITISIDPDSLIEELDETNNSQSIEVNVTDLSPPTIEILSVPEILPLFQPVDLTALIDDNDAISEVSVIFNDMVLDINNPKMDSFYVSTLFAEAEGTYLLSILATDVSGKSTLVRRMVEVVDTRADLSILTQNITYEVNEPNQAMITYRIQNIGGTDVPVASVEISDDIGTIIHEATFPLAKRTDTSISFIYHFPEGTEDVQSLQFLASADTAERDLENNRATRQIELFDQLSPSAPILSFNSEWTHQASETINWNPSEDASGIRRYEYKLNHGSWVDIGQLTSLTINFSSTGLYELKVRAIDGKGNIGKSSLAELRYDQTPPNSPTLNHPFPLKNWTNDDSVIYCWNPGVDAGSGLKEYRLSINDEELILPDSIHCYSTALLHGTNTISLVSVDQVGLISEPAQLTIQVDQVAPEAIHITSSTHMEEEGWYSNIEPLLEWSTPEDDSGIDRYYYEVSSEENLSLNSSNPEISGDRTSLTPLFISSNQLEDIPLHDGIWYVHLMAVDSAGNEGEQTKRKLQIDTTSPLLTLNYEGTSLVDSQVINPAQIDVLEVNATDRLSGVRNIYYKIDGGEENTLLDQQIDLSSLSNQSVTIYAKDEAGNNSDTMTIFVSPTHLALCELSDTLNMSNFANIAFELQGNDSIEGLTVLLSDLPDQISAPAVRVDQALIGIRFEDVPIDSGAVVQCARVVFHFEAGTNLPTHEISVHVQAEASSHSLAWEKSIPPSFLPRKGISSRSRTSTSATGNFQLSASSVASFNLANIVQEVINTRGWTKGNSLSFIMERLELSHASTAIEDSIWNQLTTVSLLLDVTPPSIDPYSPLSFDNCPGEIAVGDSFLLSVTLFDPENQYPEAEILLSSSDSNYAYVDSETGLLVGLAPGTVSISAYLSDSSLITTCIVNIDSLPEPIDSSDTTYLAIPGKIEAENYSFMNGITIQQTDDIGGGMNISEIQNGDFADYFIDVAQEGYYQISLRIASDSQGGWVNININDTTLLFVPLRFTNGWQNWITVSRKVFLKQGKQKLSLNFNRGVGLIANVNWLEMIPIKEHVGDPGAIPIPGRVEAEDYDAKIGGVLKSIQGQENGIKLAEILPGNGTAYALKVDQAGMYRVDFRISSLHGLGKIKVIVYGIVDSSIQIVPTGGWNMWDTVSTNIYLPAGEQRLFLGFVGEEAQFIVDLDWMDFRINNPSFSDVVAEPADQVAKLKVYPNPFSGAIDVDLSTFDGKIKLEWYDTKGAIIWEKVYEPGIYHIQDPIISKLANGIYYLRAVNSSEQQVLKIHKH